MAPSASAAVFFWVGTDGNGNNNSQWENATNWSATRTGVGGVGIPGAGDKAVLTKGTGSHVVRIRSILSVGAIELNNLWTGSLLIGTGTLKIGTGGLRIGSGYFVGGTSPISLSGSYTQTGGIVRGLQGTLSLSGSMTITTPGATPTYFTSTGTIVFSGFGTQTFTPLQRGRFKNMIVRNNGRNGANSIVIATNNLALSGSLTISQGRLDLSTNSKTLRMNGITIANYASGALVTNSDVTNSGSVTISGSSPTVTISAGTWTQVSQSNTTLNFAGKPVYNFTLNNTGVSGSKTETLGGALNMSGALTITSGVLDTSTTNYGMSITGAMNNSGTFNANGSAITVGGNWTTQASGSFAGGTSTVTMNGANKTLSGSTTFYRFVKSPSGNDTLNFAVGTTTTTTNRLTLASAAGTLSLRSTTNGSRYTVAAVGNVYTIGTLDVKDSDASYTIVCQDCTNSGNNSDGWVFTTTSASTTTTSGTSGGGGSGGGGGRAYLNTSTPAPATPAPRAPVVPVTKVTPPNKQVPRTLSERLQERRRAREAALTRIKERAAQRKAKSRR
ncbi:hypothetical protein HYW84_02255 [Candidatus Peregrinibacteria bacterium]|nr:hypothetical protein [Candidatus Peregrinibacteria bacterium]